MSDQEVQAKRSFVGSVRIKLRLWYDLLVFNLLSLGLLIAEIWKSTFPKHVDVKGKLALVTGAGGGLGRSISLKLAELKCNVAVVDINEETAAKVAEELIKKGVRAKSYKADITNKDDIKKLRENVKNDLGMVDILINNAGLIPDNCSEDKPGALEAMFRVNMLGTIYVSHQPILNCYQF